MTNAPTNRQKFGYLPHVLSLLLPEIGEDGVMKLVQEFGGDRLYVNTAGKKLSAVLGSEITSKVIFVMNENIIFHFDVPLMRNYQVLQKNLKIEAAYNAGELVKDIAKKFSMTERGVYKALRKLRDDGRKQSLRADQRIAKSIFRSKEARRLHEEGVDIEEIAERLGVSRSSVIRYLEDE